MITLVPTLELRAAGERTGGGRPPTVRGVTIPAYTLSLVIQYILISMSVSVLMSKVERACSLTAPEGCGQTLAD
jgi:hypothetical protein